MSKPQQKGRKVDRTKAMTEICGHPVPAKLDNRHWFITRQTIPTPCAKNGSDCMSSFTKTDDLHLSVIPTAESFCPVSMDDSCASAYLESESATNVPLDCQMEPLSYSTQFGCSALSSILLSIIVITPENDPDMKELCDSVMLSLSQYFIFCQISVYQRNDCSFVLGNTYCDLCIVDRNYLNAISMSFPNIVCSSYTYAPITVDVGRWSHE